MASRAGRACKLKVGSTLWRIWSICAKIEKLPGPRSSSSASATSAAHRWPKALRAPPLPAPVSTRRSISAGTGDWHVGRPPDPRAQVEARRRGVDISALRGRQLRRADFYDFDLILAADTSNLRDARALRPADATADLRLMLDLLPDAAGRASPIPIMARTTALPRRGTMSMRSRPRSSPNFRRPKDNAPPDDSATRHDPFRFRIA